MIYLDTSAAVPLFVPEPASDAVDAWLASYEGPLVSSDWLVTELASALSIKQRAGALSARHAAAAWRAFQEFSRTGLVLAPPSRAVFRTAAKLARRHAHGLRAGDALHLASALEIGARSIVTLDATMVANARRLRIKTVVL